jgi:hypothetical protein
MATATFDPKVVNSTYFNPAVNIIQTGVATSGSTLTGKLPTSIILQNWNNTGAMPLNSTIQDIQVLISCRLVSGSAPTINAEFQLNKNTLSATVSSGTLSTITLGGTSDSSLTWGGFFNAKDLLQNGGLNVLVLYLTNSVGSVVEIDSVSLNVTYTTSSTYLQGSRSIYNGLDSGYIDNLSLVQNGDTVSNLITSEDINKLGDCLINIERIALSNSNFYFGGIEKSGTQFMYVTTLTFNHVHTTDWPNIISFELCRSGSFGLFNNSFSKDNIPGSVVVTTPNGNAILNKTKLDFVSAMGWYNVAGTNYPLFVSPKTLYIGGTSDLTFSNPEYFISFTAVAPTLYNTDNTLTYQSYNKTIRSTILPALPDSAVTIKLVGFGSE